ncbi:MAG: guanylate cyclase [Nitrospirae bacterium]|nr:guanylate cyclase [Nitrospirota bacterium]
MDIESCKKTASVYTWLGICAFAFILVFLLPLVLPLLENVLPYGLFYSLISFDKTLSTIIVDMVPFNMSMKIFLCAAIAFFTVLLLFFNHQRKYYNDLAVSTGVRRDFEALKVKAHLPDNSKVLTPLKERLESGAVSGRGDRDELIKLFAETKKKLDNMGKDLAFLSIDIMDSTGMKQGEEKAAIEHDFKEYKLMVDKIISRHKALKSAWTPDGVMICFSDTEDAVNAGKDVIRSLDNFNRHVKAIRQNFRVRCGVNSGFVYCDESTPMEEMSDRVIDIAGHMQKYAQPNSIFAGKSVVGSLHDRSGFEPAGKVVDGLEAAAWKDTA